MSEFTKNNPKEAIFYKSLLADWWLSKLDQSLKSQREEIEKRVEQRQDLFNFVPEINGYKYIKAKDLDIISLIQNK